jgi:hypothetical protein
MNAKMSLILCAALGGAVALAAFPPPEARAASCLCCRNLEAKLKAAERGSTPYFARRPWFEAKKVMGEGGEHVSMPVGKTCSPKDRETEEYRQLKARLGEVDKAVAAVEAKAGYRLDPAQPLYTNDKGVWCCNWTTKDGKVVQQ